ncbi:MAG: bifunctional DedA family/phosphatase PAP2 family protein [bacterium]
MHFLQNLFETIRHILQNGGLGLLFLVALVESLPILGALIPGHTIIIFAGFLARLGVFNLWATMAVISLGAIGSDMLGYHIGKKYGMTRLNKYGKYVFIKPEYIAKAKAMLDRHSGKAIIAGRFNPVTRAFVPLLAGVSNMAPKKFWIYNIIGGVSWAVSSVLLGYAFGASYELAAGYVGKFLLFAFIGAVLLIWAYYFLEHREHLFARRHLLTLCVNIPMLFIFFKMVEDVFMRESFMSGIDVSVNLFMVNHFNPLLVKIAEGISFLADTKMVAVVSLFVVAYLLLKKKWQVLTFYIFTLGGGAGIGLALKHVVARIRPENALVSLSDFSFPSGHSIAAGIFFGCLAYLVYISKWKKGAKNTVYSVLFALMLLVPLTRVYLRVHWLSDVIAGLSFGLFWLTLCMLIFHVFSKRMQVLQALKKDNTNPL